MVFGLFKKKEPVKVTVKGSGETFMCEPNELLMKAALRQNIAWPCSCKPTALLKKDEMDNGMVIACQWTPTSDITVEVNIGGEADKRGMI